MSSRKPLYGDLLSALFIVALSIYIISQALPWGLYDAVGPGPGFFPIIYGGLMFVLGLGLLVRSLVATRDVPEAAPSIDREGTYAALGAWLALALSVPLMVVVGFVGGFGLLAVFLIKVIFKKPMATSLIASAAITAGLYLLFQVLLEVDLPPSLLGGR